MCTTTPGEDAFWWAYGLFVKPERKAMRGTFHYHSLAEAAYGDRALGHTHSNAIIGHHHGSSGVSESASDAQSHPTLPYHRLGGSAGTCVGIPCAYEQFWSCSTEACEEIWCGEDGFRNFCYPHAARIKTFHRSLRQAHGREAGHQIAVDALVALASAPYPVDLIDGVGTAEETHEAKEDFDRAARRELLKTIQESIVDSQPEGRWCILHQGYHPFSEGMCCWVREDADEAPVRELSEEEGRVLFRRQCRRYLDMSAEEFIRKWRAGEFDDRADTTNVMRVAMLLPLFDKRKAP